VAGASRSGRCGSTLFGHLRDWTGSKSGSPFPGEIGLMLFSMVYPDTPFLLEAMTPLVVG